MPEITLNDSFGRAIRDTVIKHEYTKNLEIGSHDGTGSTQCFIEGMEILRGPCVYDNFFLYCIELNRDRWEELNKNTIKHKVYSAGGYVWTFNMSTISMKSFIPKSFDEIWDSPYNHLLEGELSFPKEMVRGWYEDDIKQLSAVKDGEGWLECKNHGDGYDAVLIDGGEFVGYSEFLLLKDITKCFMLDDVFSAYKCAQVYDVLSKDSNWKLLEEDRKLRNGYAIFRRINNEKN